MSYVNSVVIGGWVKGGSVKPMQGRTAFELGVEYWDSRVNAKAETFLWVELAGKSAEKLTQYLTTDKQVTLVGKLNVTQNGIMGIIAWDCSFGGKKWREEQGGGYSESSTQAQSFNDSEIPF